MRLQFVSVEGVGVIVCEHCNNDILAFKPVKEFMLPLMYCGKCRKNTAGDLTPPPPDFMK